MLVDILGSEQVYFQPPATVKMTYPCIVYNLADINSRYADNIPYLHRRRYSVTVIDRDPDSVIRDKLSDVECCAFERAFTSDNLYHYVFRLIF